jgi:hypothetical protein
VASPEDRNFEDWRANSAIAEAARSRRRTASWAQHGHADAGLAGVLLDLAERGADVIISLVNDHSHRGVVLAVASTWAMLRTNAGARVAIRLRAIAALDCSGQRSSFGERCAPITTGFVPMLEGTVEPGEQLTVWCGHQRLSGELVGLGDELMVLNVDSSTLRYVSIDAIDEVVIAGRSERSWRSTPSG